MTQSNDFNADMYKKQALQQLKGRWPVPMVMTLISFWEKNKRLMGIRN